MAEKLIYLIDDDPDIRNLLGRTLEEYGMRTRGFSSGETARRAIARHEPDLCIVDLGLPDMDGLTLVRELWGNPRIGCVILSGRSSTPDRILGLEVGADDYMVKPFEPRELVARVSSVLRRMDLNATAQSSRPEGIARFSGWIYDPNTLSLSGGDGTADTLSAAESQLLMALLRAPNRVLSRDQLLGDAAGDRDPAFDRSIDVRISRLRKKLEADPAKPRLIRTIYGAGYLFASAVEWG
ncbi:MAG: response regulator transcription factor [Gammaproteobacteria bacterium]